MDIECTWVIVDKVIPFLSVWIESEEGSTLPEDSVPLRSTPAPPTISCVICYANNLYLAGPSPYPCPGVDTPPGGYSLPLPYPA